MASPVSSVMSVKSNRGGELPKEQKGDTDDKSANSGQEKKKKNVFGGLVGQRVDKESRDTPCPRRPLHNTSRRPWSADMPRRVVATLPPSNEQMPPGMLRHRYTTTLLPYNDAALLATS